MPGLAAISCVLSTNTSIITISVYMLCHCYICIRLVRLPCCFYYLTFNTVYMVLVRLGVIVRTVRVNVMQTCKNIYNIEKISLYKIFYHAQISFSVCYNSWRDVLMSKIKL